MSLTLKDIKLKRLIIILIAFMAVWSGKAMVSNAIPPVPDPPRLVNDFAGVLTSAQIQEKEDRLVAFNDSTSNVICVVTVSDLGDYSAAEFAYEIGDQWGVRDKGYENGVVLLIKPRNETSGEVYIAVGYDLEGVIPDIIAKRIIEDKMMPALRVEDYNAAIDSALAYILPLAAGEISVERFKDSESDTVETALGLFFFIILILVIVYFSKKGTSSSGDGSHYGGSFFPPVRSGGNWSDFGGGFGGGSFGGGGGFGGFGGSGGFGGGGAGGRF